MSPVLLLILPCLAAPVVGQQAVLEPIEGIVATDLEDGATAYECAGEKRRDVDIVLNPMLVRARSGTRLSHIGLYLRDVNDGEMGPLILSIDGKTTRLVIPTDYMKMELSGTTASATVTIETNRRLMQRIASAQAVEAEYRARKFSLKASLSPDDKDRFRRIVDLEERGSLPPAALLGGGKVEKQVSTDKPPEGLSQPELLGTSRVAPHYPAEARMSHRNGHVVLLIHILKDGTVASLRPLEVTPIGSGFSKASMDVVRRWRYKPALQDGQPVEMDFKVVVDFSFSSSPLPR